MQNQIKELDDFKEIAEGTLDELSELTQSLSHKEKKKQIKQYIQTRLRAETKAYFIIKMPPMSSIFKHWGTFYSYFLFNR